MAQNLFDIIYSGYSTPLEAEQLKAQVQIKQNEAQAGLLELAQQKATMGAMQQIWGSPLGPDAATGTDADRPKLEATARYLMMKGNVKDATGILSRVASIDERQAMTAKDRMAEETQRRQDLSQTAGAVSDQATYSAAFPSLMEKLGPDAGRLRLTGIYEQDKPKLDFLSKSGATWAQKQQVAEREQSIKDNYLFRSLGAGLAQQRLEQANQRLDFAKRAADRADASLQLRKEEDAKRDARLQQGLKRDPAKEYATNLKVTPREDKDAAATFGVDARTVNMDPNLQGQYAKLAAGRAKEMIANELRANPNSDINFDTAMATVMDQMEGEGLFKPTSTGGWWGGETYSYKAPSWTKGGGTGQGTPPAGKASKPAAPAGQYPTLDSVQKAVKSGALTRDQGIEIARKNGWVK